jgi:hypothetical protein
VVLIEVGLSGLKEDGYEDQALVAIYPNSIWLDNMAHLDVGCVSVFCLTAGGVDVSFLADLPRHSGLGTPRSFRSME